MAVGAAGEAPAALAADPLTQLGSPAGASQPCPDLVDTLRHVTSPVGRNGWLDVLADVLAAASDERIPVLERARLLAVFSLQLDAFFMIHVGDKCAANGGSTAFRRAGPAEDRLHELSAEHDRLLQDDVLPALTAEGVGLPGWGELNGLERQQCRQLFQDVVHPLLTPLVADATHPFPQVSTLSLNLGVLLRDRRSGAERFACVQVPTGLPGFVRLDARRLVCIDEIVGASLGELFRGMHLLERSSFRVTRTEAFDTGPKVDGVFGKGSAASRRLGLPVRLEVEQPTSARMLDFLVRNLDVAPADVYRVRAPLGMAAPMLAITGDRAPTLSPPTELFPSGPGRSPLAVLPASAATSGRAFLEAAASDPTVIVIAQTLSDRGVDSGVVDALVSAAAAGKQVLVILESRARDRELGPSTLGRRLTSAGCQVRYGPARVQRACALGLALSGIGGSDIRCHAHVCAPGHYPRTDGDPSCLGLMSAEAEVGSDVARRLLRLAGSSQSEGPAQTPGLQRDPGVAVHLLRMSSRIAGR